MQRPPLIRSLRIAVSAVFGLVLVLLVVLWLRSYWRMDWLRVTRPSWSVASIDGRLRFNDVYNLNDSRQQQTQLLIIRRYRGSNFSLWYAGNDDLLPVGVGKTVPIWPMVLIATALTALPWTRARFSLRTLLLATSLMAIVLGLIVWRAR